MNSAHWLNYFQQNCLSRPEPDWSAPLDISASVARHLARSLSHFQLGESGEGRFLLDQARRSYADDPDYCEALALFIREEQEHARLLELLVARFAGQLITKHWTHALFRLLRRALGIHFEIQVLVIAELVGTAYYRLLLSQASDGAIRQVCELVLRDEAQHVAFHAERFATNQEPWLPLERLVWASQFQCLFLVAADIAWFDHGNALRSIGASRSDFIRLARRECVAFLQSAQPQAVSAAAAVPSL